MRGFRLALASLLTAALLAPGTALGSTPEGPRLAASVFHVFPNAGTEVTSVGSLGESRMRLAGGPDGSEPGPLTATRPAWSPDGRLLAFTGAARGTAGLFVVRADGSHPRLLRSSRDVLFQGDPVFTPDGEALAVTAIQRVRGQFERAGRKGPSEQKLDVRFALWAIAVDGSPPRPLTPWQRRALLAPGAFAPNGRALVATASGREGQQVVAIRVGDGLHGGMRVLAKEAREPVLSPDGSRIAFVRDRFGPAYGGNEGRVLSSDLLSMPFSGGSPTLVASSPGGLRWPSWDPSGRRLAFTGLSGTGPAIGSDPHQGNSVMQVNADGSCLSRVLTTRRGIAYGSAWQPGPGRGAGPIAC
jgi:Tol biopolymer transport system component